MKKMILPTSSTNEFWLGLINVNLTKASRILNGLHPLSKFILVLIGLVLAGWLICSGLAECWEIIYKYIIPIYRDVANS
jgi:hypothetical protein